MYKKHEERRGWARDQMIAANVPEATVRSVEELLETWWSEKVPDPQVVVAVEVFSHLAQGHALVEEEDRSAVYAPVRVGGVHMRDTVRVKLDAYSGPSGEAHNGRRGVVVGVRHGDVVVRYMDGKQPAIEASHHSPQALEKRIR